MLKKWLDNDSKPTLVCVCISAVSLVLSLGGWLKNVLPFDIAWIAIILCGIPIVVGAVTALITEHDVKADVLVSIALIASVGTSEFFASGEVALIMQIGSLLEDFTADRARKGFESLVKLTPKTARVKRDGKDVMIPVESVAVGDILTVIAGETIPVDGILLSGETSIDQSVMTGESIPVDKKAGDPLTSGTVNQLGTFEMKALKTCGDSSLQRMIALAEEADANKAPIVGLADKWASWMVGIALVCAIVTGLVSGEFIRAVTVLVVFCPCAFILATPTAVAAAIGNLTKYGILIRTGDALERLSQVQEVAFDKTGTLTYGKPELIAVKSLREDLSDADILKVTALAEQYSEYPLGRAIVEKYLEKENELSEVKDFKVLAGQGITAVIDRDYVVMEKKNIQSARVFSHEDIKISTDIAPGDLGYIVYMHGKFYGEEYNYSEKFEGYIAENVSHFLLNYNSDKDCLWMARDNEKIIGSIAILDEKDHADIRWFLVDPQYRGVGPLQLTRKTLMPGSARV